MPSEILAPGDLVTRKVRDVPVALWNEPVINKNSYIIAEQGSEQFMFVISVTDRYCFVLSGSVIGYINRLFVRKA